MPPRETRAVLLFETLYKASDIKMHSEATALPGIQAIERFRTGELVKRQLRETMSIQLNDDFIFWIASFQCPS